MTLSQSIGDSKLSHASMATRAEAKATPGFRITTSRILISGPQELHLLKKHGPRVVGVGWWTHDDPPAWGPMCSQIFPLRKYIHELRLWERATGIEPHRRAALCVANLHGTARAYIENLMAQPNNLDQITFGAAVAGGARAT